MVPTAARDRPFNLTEFMALRIAEAPTIVWVYWFLRVSLCMTWVGHGAFGIITKAEWLPYFAFTYIPEWLAWPLMPLIGAMDITMGIITLVSPRRAIFAWGVIWCVWTAALRPLVGQGIWEFFERGGNYGVPLALLFLCGFGRNWREWFLEPAKPRVGPTTTGTLIKTLRYTTALLLIGHGGFGAVLHKEGWYGYFQALGIGPETVNAYNLIDTVGWFEIALGGLVLAYDWPPLLIGICAWKVGTELLRPMAGENFFEWIERGGSYFAPLALAVLVQAQAQVLPRFAPQRHAEPYGVPAGD